MSSAGEFIPGLLILSSIQGRHSHCTRPGVWPIYSDSQSAFHDQAARR